MSAIAPHIQKSFERQTMMQTLQAELIACAAGHAEISGPILPLALQQHGYGHAGLAFSLGDTAMGYAGLSMAPEGREVVTAEVKINLLAPTVGERIVARGRVVKPGRRLIVLAADVFAVADGEETHVAMLTGTVVPVDP